MHSQIDSVLYIGLHHGLQAIGSWASSRCSGGQSARPTLTHHL